MTATSSRSRVPAGVRAGGQFTVEARSEPDVAIGATGQPREVGRGKYEVANSMTEVPDPWTISGAPGLVCLPNLRARFETAALRMQMDEQVDTLEDKLAALQGHEATVLLADRSGSVHAYEGRLGTDFAGQQVLFAKGSRDRGVVLRRNAQPYGRRLPDPAVLGVLPGYGGQRHLAEQFAHHLAKTPELEPVSVDDIPADDGSDHDAIAAVFVFHHPGFDESQDGRGSLFFATDVTPGQAGASDPTAAVNGYAVFSPRSGLTSEHGSLYLGDLARWGGRVKGFQAGSMAFRDAMDLARRVDAIDDIPSVWEMLA